MATQATVEISRPSTPFDDGPTPMAIQAVTEIPRSPASLSTQKPVLTATSPTLMSTEALSPADYPVDIRIDISSSDNKKYEAVIDADKQKLQKVKINTTVDDLMELNKNLQEVMQYVAKKTGELAELEVLRELATVGYDAFTKVFEDNIAKAVIQEVLNLSRRGFIHVSSEDFFLPWELIYPVSLDEQLSYEYFWGMRYIISRHVRDVYTGPRLSPFIPRQPVLGLLTNKDVWSSVEEKEIPFFEKLKRDGKIRLISLGELNPDNKDEGIKEFQSFWDNTLHLAHFACHACYKEPADDSYILLSKRFDITLRNMRHNQPNLESHPLIVMNACETGNLNPKYTACFVTAFIRYGARGVVATECEVPDAFAAEFTEQLYTNLLARKTLGESLLATRRYFLEKHYNPSGLLYSLYAPPNIQISQI